MSHPSDEHRTETKAEADRARETQFERTANFILGAVGFLANKPTRWLLTFAILVILAGGGYTIYWFNNRYVKSETKADELQNKFDAFREMYHREIAELRAEHFKFLVVDHAHMVTVVEECTKSNKECSRIMSRLEQILDKK